MVIFPLKIEVFHLMFLIHLNLIVQNGTRKEKIHSLESHFQDLVITHPPVKLGIVKRMQGVQHFHPLVTEKIELGILLKVVGEEQRKEYSNGTMGVDLMIGTRTLS